MQDNRSDLDQAIALARGADYLRALVIFLDIYGTEEGATAAIRNAPRAASGLSYFGLCLALVQRKYKVAIDLCKRAVELEFYQGEHYANLARVYVAAGNRRKAVEIAEAGLRQLPDHELLLEVRRELGVRRRPPIPFLDREHPLNVTLGQARRAREIAKEAKKGEREKKE